MDAHSSKWHWTGVSISAQQRLAYHSGHGGLLVQDFLYGDNIKHLRLDGDTQQAQRQKSMDLFNAPNSDYHIFLLTTRAGGVGINLASADTIILHDPDFNPHQDQQVSF